MQTGEVKQANETLEPLWVSKRETCRLLGDISVRTLENWISRKVAAGETFGRTDVPALFGS
jgi:hypothetical protein